MLTQFIPWIIIAIVAILALYIAKEAGAALGPPWGKILIVVVAVLLLLVIFSRMGVF